MLRAGTFSSKHIYLDMAYNSRRDSDCDKTVISFVVAV